MKPHSNLHALSNPLLALQAAMGQQGLMLDAGKDALLADAADTGFAGIMAKQLAQVSGEESMVAAEHQATTPVDAASAQEADEQGAAVTAMPEPVWAMELPVMPEQAVPGLLNLPVEPKANLPVQTTVDAMSTAARGTETSPMQRVHGEAVSSAPVTELPVANRAASVSVATSEAGTPGAAQPTDIKLNASLPEQPATDAIKTQPTPALAGAPVPVSTSVPSSVSMARYTSTNTERRTPSTVANTSAASSKDTGPTVGTANLANRADVPRQGMPAATLPLDEQATLIEAPDSLSVRWSASSQQASRTEAVDAADVVGAGMLQTKPADVLKSAPSVVPTKSMDTPAVAARSVEAKVPGNVPLPLAGSVVSDAVVPEALMTMPTMAPAVPQGASVATKLTEGTAPLTLGALLATGGGASRSAPSTVEAVTLRSIQRSTDASREVAQPLQNQFLAKFANGVDESLLPETPSMPMATTAAPVAGVLAEAVRSQHDQGLQGYDSTSMPTGMSLPAVASQVFQQPIRHEAASLQQTVGTAAFTDELIGQVNVWVKQSAQEGPMTAELHLNPADMGPVLIRIEVDGNLAQVNFAAQQADTRQAIESSMSMLSASLKEVGIQLSGSGVSDQGASSQQAWGFDGRGEGGQPRQSSQAFAMAAQQNQSAARGATDALPEPWLPNTPSRPGGAATGLDLYA
jgi:flagellar hook-length control protein FliK